MKNYPLKSGCAVTMSEPYRIVCMWCNEPRPGGWCDCFDGAARREWWNPSRPLVPLFYSYYTDDAARTASNMNMLWKGCGPWTSAVIAFYSCVAKKLSKMNLMGRCCAALMAKLLKGAQKSLIAARYIMTSMPVPAPDMGICARGMPFMFGVLEYKAVSLGFLDSLVPIAPADLDDADPVSEPRQTQRPFPHYCDRFGLVAAARRTGSGVRYVRYVPVQDSNGSRATSIATIQIGAVSARMTIGDWYAYSDATIIRLVRQDSAEVTVRFTVGTL